jgi:adenine deaminase
MSQSLTVHLVDLHLREIRPVQIVFAANGIQSIQPAEPGETPSAYLLPGFIDAHIHIESSMLCPAAFAAEAVKHGTVATISDPHEIGNVLGTAGVDFMIQNGKQVPFHFFFGAPSCVPATPFENAGASISPAEVAALLAKPEIVYLSEMMNYPGVLFNDAGVMAKIAAAKASGKPIDGHAPGLRGENALKYFAAGISTDHECFTLEEAVEKAEMGVKILIREGSAARNFDALHPLLKSHPQAVMFCSDDKHPDELLQGHINQLVARAVALDYDLFDVLRAACLHPIEHYRLPVGQVRVGDPADFILVKDLQDFEVLATCIQGKWVYEKGQCQFEVPLPQPINQFHAYPIDLQELHCEPDGNQMRVIDAMDGQLITQTFLADLSVLGPQKNWPASDVLKIVVVNRYQKAAPAVAYIRGFGLKNAAIGGTVAHDSHNMVVVGTHDHLILQSIEALMASEGGLVYADETQTKVLPLPVAGLMSTFDCAQTGELYGELDLLAKQAGAKLRAPYMTLSFMSLLVIPQLKLSDLGLFDGQKFEFVSLFEQ